MGIKYEILAAIVLIDTMVSNATSLKRYGIPKMAENTMLNQTALAGTLDFVSLASQFENGIAPSRAKAYVCREEPTMTAAPLMQPSLESL